MKGNNGYSLIELMIVVAIVAILIAVGAPLYKEKMIHARISVALNYMITYRTDFVDYFNRTGRFPPSSSPSNIAINDQFLSTINYQSNIAEPNTMWIRGNLDTNAIGLPSGVGDRITILIAYDESSNTIVLFCGKWNAGLPSLDNDYLPPGCKDEGLSGLINVYN